MDKYVELKSKSVVELKGIWGVGDGTQESKPGKEDNERVSDNGST